MLLYATGDVRHMATAQFALHLPRDLAPGEWRTRPHHNEPEPERMRESWTAEVLRNNSDPQANGTIPAPTQDSHYWLRLTAYAPYGDQSFVLHASLPQLMALGDMIAEQARALLDAHVEAVGLAQRAEMYDAGLVPPAAAVEEIIGLGSVAPPAHECDDSCTHDPIGPWGSALKTGASPQEA